VLENLYRDREGKRTREIWNSGPRHTEKEADFRGEIITTRGRGYERGEIRGKRVGRGPTLGGVGPNGQRDKEEGTSGVDVS